MTIIRTKIPKEKTCTLMVWGIPKALKQKFKIECARKGIPMREAIMDFLRRFPNA